LISGRLRVVVPSEAGEAVVSELGRGEIVGEMALIDGSPRSATVYAVRDSRLAKISRSAFDRLTEHHPAALKWVARSVAARLRVQIGGGKSRDSAISTIAVVPASPGVAISELASRLAAALEAHGTTRLLNAGAARVAFPSTGMAAAGPGDPASIRLGQWLDEQEGGHRFVVYEADGQDLAWTDRVVGQADHLLIFADAKARPTPGELEERLVHRWPEDRAPRRSLVLVHSGLHREPSGTSRWIERRSLDAHYHLHPRRPADFERLARILAGRAIGLVFGGGGARGFAHLGVLRALDAVGVPVDFVGGTSIGAIIAGAHAMGLSSREAVARCKEHFAGVIDPTLPLVALLSGRQMGSQIDAGFGQREIEDLRIPFFCISTNLTTASETVHRFGPLASALRASVSIPGVFPPVVEDGQLLVDGALLNNLPADVMQGLCMGGPVIAVDVAPNVDLVEPYDFPPSLSGWELLWNRIHPLRKPREVPSIVNVLIRSSLVASKVASRRRCYDDERDLRLSIPLDEWKMLDFGPVEAIAESGYQASLQRIADWWAKRNTA
jgi:predicted acylesterase/phospholipase RssA